MDTLDLFRLIAPLAIILVTFVVLLLRAGRRRGVLQKKYAKQFQGARAVAALCANESDLAGQPRQLLQAAKGFVLIGGDRAAGFVGSRFSADETHDFDRPQGWRMSFLPSSAIAIGLPDMIRVADADEAYFLIGLGAFDQPSKTATKKLYEDLQRRLDRMPGAELPATSNPPILIAALALLLAAVGVTVYAAMQISKPLGPQILARGPEGSVLTATEDALLRFSADGAKLTAVPLRSLGFDAGVAGLRALPDGSILAGNFGEGVIERCATDASKCAPLKVFADSSFRFRGGFSFEVDRAGTTLFASDSGRHRMLEMSLDGGVIEEYRGPGRHLCFPNTIRLVDDGRLLVADTNNFRILEWASAKGWPEPEPIEHATVERTPPEYRCLPNDREGRGNAHVDRARDYHIVGRPRAFTGLGRASTWVAQFDHASDGRWWVVFNGENVRRGDVGIMDAAWALQTVVDLPVGADPWDVLAVDDGALVADPVAARIYHFNARGLQISDFGRKALDDYLEPAKRRRELLELSRIAAPAAMAVIVLPLLPIGLHLRKRRVQKILSLPKPGG